MIIPLASTKGGVSKTSLTVALAYEYRRRGLTVAVVDADPNRPLALWFRDGRVPGVLHEPADADEVMARITRLDHQADLVLVDLQGTANQAMLFALGKADGVLIPSKAGVLDLREGLKTWTIVSQASELVGRAIPAAVILTQTSHLRTKISEQARADLEAKGVPLLDVEFVQRVAISEMTYTRSSPGEDQPQSAAAANIRAIADAVAKLFKFDHLNNGLIESSQHRRTA
jgi:chromosome partitioning protein